VKTALVIPALLALTLAGCKKNGDAKPETNEARPAPEATKTAPAPAPDEGKPAVTAKSFDASALYDMPVATLDGKPSKIGEHRGKALLVVNVASKCGLTPQYETLEKLQKDYAGKGFTVLGFPCNQFGGQEPGSPEEIAAFCSRTYGVTFPMFEKIEVNGDGRHPIYKVLTAVEDAKGEAGDIQWNFEKFVISADGKAIHRFRPKTKPDAPEVIAAIEAGLPPGQ
jgi:glutathione peroxidase